MDAMCAGDLHALRPSEVAELVLALVRLRHDPGGGWMRGLLDHLETRSAACNKWVVGRGIGSGTDFRLVTRPVALWQHVGFGGVSRELFTLPSRSGDGLNRLFQGLDRGVPQCMPCGI